MKKRYFFVALLMAVCIARPVAAQGSALAPVLIAAVQTGQVGATGNDFILLHNTTEEVTDITGWRVQYRSAAATGAAAWSTKRTIACTESDAECRVLLEPHHNLLMSTYAVAGVPHQALVSGFSDTGGQLRLVRGSGAGIEVLDLVAYGPAAEAEQSPAAPPAVGEVLVRKSTADGNLIDTDDNQDDFTNGCYAPALVVVPVAVMCQGQTGQPAEDPAEEVPASSSEPEPQPIVYPPLFITELLPDPASPAADSADEFIELYNPAPYAVSAKGYVLQAGADFRYQFVLGDLVIPAGGYAGIYAAESHLSLTNAGTQVRIVDPAGVVLDTVANYGQAKTGQAWAEDAQGWRWTTTATPGSANVITTEPPKLVLAASAVAKKVSAAKKSATTTAKTAKTTASKQAKTAAATAGRTAAESNNQSGGGGNLQYIALAVVGLFVAGYVIYEYRQDIARLGRKIWQRVKPQESNQQG